MIICYRQQNQEWSIVQEHLSVLFDTENVE